LLHVTIWRARALHRRLRSDPEGAKLARAWARAFQGVVQP
jgi:hypothetical protein